MTQEEAWAIYTKDSDELERQHRLAVAVVDDAFAGKKADVYHRYQDTMTHIISLGTVGRTRCRVEEELRLSKPFKKGIDGYLDVHAREPRKGDSQ